MVRAQVRLSGGGQGSRRKGSRFVFQGVGDEVVGDGGRGCDSGGSSSNGSAMAATVVTWGMGGAAVRVAMVGVKAFHRFGQLPACLSACLPACLPACVVSAGLLYD